MEFGPNLFVYPCLASPSAIVPLCKNMITLVLGSREADGHHGLGNDKMVP